MNTSQHQALIDWYHTYVKNFASQGELSEMMRLKYAHSCAVAAVAREIAEREGWQMAEIRRAEIIGLYHDLGRYRQYQQYGTFQDYRSVDHGECGAGVIKETQCLAILEPAERALITLAVRYHNARVIPDNLTAMEKKFLTLARDSDKIDIYRVHRENYVEKVFARHPEVFHGVKQGVPAAPAIVEAALNHQPIGYEQVRSMADFLVVTVQWFYDFHFATSYQMLRERKVLDLLAELIPPSPAVNKLLATTQAYLATRT